MPDDLHPCGRIFPPLDYASTMLIQKSPIHRSMIGDLCITFIEPAAGEPLLPQKCIYALHIVSGLGHGLKLHIGLSYGSSEHSRTFTEQLPGLILSGKVAAASEMQ